MKHIKFPLFVFDVESVGLHGPAFAVGYVVLGEDGKNLEETIFVAPVRLLGERNSKWVEDNVMPALPSPNCRAASEVREKFWASWIMWKERGATMFADCAWPVEARFLAHCVDQDFPATEWQGPYPLHDIASMMLATGSDPLATLPRKPWELPAHNPLNDARQSARVLYDMIKSILP